MVVKTSQELVEELLLSGKHINKFDLLSIGHTVCLAQRILDIRQQKGWNISSASVKGKGTLKEYWLEPEEIERIKGRKQKFEQLVTEQQNHVQKPLKQAETAEYEQIGLGLLGGRNYG